LSCSFDHYREARNLLAHCRGLLDPVFEKYDVLINAPATGEAPVGLNKTGNASVCVIWTSMHVPAMTLPLFKGPNNLPIGLQLIARRNNDRGLFSAARQIWQTLS
jgi:Asp-tRNA(Asn)/Glu-tRNA(Gln) amidotransferase A subunit family amidase